MIGILFLILLGFVFYYERYIYNYYKKIVEKNGEKFIYKFLFIFLFFLPFYDIIFGYSKIALNILNEPTIQITEAAKKFKEDYILYERFSFQDDFTIEKKVIVDTFNYSIVKFDNKYFAIFHSLLEDSINKNILENTNILANTKKNLLIKYPTINFLYLSYTRIDNKYFNYFTNELLLTNNFYKDIKYSDRDIKNDKYLPKNNEYRELYNNYIFPLQMLGKPVYYEQNIRIYTMEDFLSNSDYFNVKSFIISYCFVSLLFFIFLLLRVKLLYIFCYIFFMYIMPSILSFLFFYKDLYFNKNDIIKKDLNVNPVEMLYKGCFNFSFENLINNEKEYHQNYIDYYTYNNYQFEILNYYNKDYLLKRRKCLSIYKKIYTVDSLFGYYNLYNRLDFLDKNLK